MSMEPGAGEIFRGTTAQDRLVSGERPRPLRRYWVAIVAAIVLGALLIWLLPGTLSALGAHSSVSRSRLVIATVERGTFIRDVAADGRIVAAVSPTLYAPASGNLTLLVHAGDKIAKGAVLARLDSPDVTAKLTQEQATLQSEQSDYERSQLEARVQLRSTKDAAARAKVDRDTAKRELERSRNAHELGAYSELQVLRAQDALEKAEFDLAEAQTALEARPEQNRLEVRSHEAAVERQHSLVTDLQRQVDALIIRSPVDGQIGRVDVADRAAVAKDAPLLSAVDLSALEVEIQVPESFARELAIGMPADLSGNGGEWRGRVSAVSPEVVNGQVSARVSFAGKVPTGLRQNQRMSVRIVLDERANALTVERGSFLDQDGGAVAYVVHDNVAERQRIRLGAVSVGKVQLVGGVKEGDRIVISGTEAFDGARRVILSN
jgi:HlyD family secretion protein